ncbi:hypothetical protein M0804_007913 [Polistes exclamans]|nr:hypothetical protein M0804_007913 [Polistes exclamans]
MSVSFATYPDDYDDKDNDNDYDNDDDDDVFKFARTLAAGTGFSLLGKFFALRWRAHEQATKRATEAAHGTAELKS